MVDYIDSFWGDNTFFIVLFEEVRRKKKYRRFFEY